MSAEEQPGGDDRRTYERRRIWFPVTLAQPDGPDLQGVCHDASTRGLLVHTKASLEGGKPIRVTLFIPSHPNGHVVGAAVVRSSPNAQDPDGMWPHRVALAFDEPVSELADLTEEAFGSEV